MRFDITYEDGVADALGFIKCNATSVSSWALPLAVLGPLALTPLAPAAVAIAAAIGALRATSKGSEVRKRKAELVADILKAGNNSGASEIEVIIDEDIGVDLSRSTVQVTETE